MAYTYAPERRPIVHALYAHTGEHVFSARVTGPNVQMVAYCVFDLRRNTEYAYGAPYCGDAELSLWCSACIEPRGEYRLVII